VEDFGTLIDRLIYTRSRNGKLELIAAYLRRAPDPDAGWALAALTGGLDFPAVKPSAVRALIGQRVDPVLFALSRDYVGDTAETVSLLWPEPDKPAAPPGLSEAVAALAAMTRATVHAGLAALLDRLDAKGRFALLKLATGRCASASRRGWPRRLSRRPLPCLSMRWRRHGMRWSRPMPIFSPGRGGMARGQTPRIARCSAPLCWPIRWARSRSISLILPPNGNGTASACNWSAWGETRLYSRGGDDITAAFPEVARDFTRDGVLDGELLVRGSHQGGEEGGAASFNALQQRLGRKQVSARMLEEYPAFVRLYDVLMDGGEDLRALPWHQRRKRLESIMPSLPATRFDLSLLIEAADFHALSLLRDGARDAAIEGVMLKRRDSPYVAGRRVGLWYKWKRDALTADCVLMYAQRGSGKRSSFYSDYTFGCWTAPPDQGGELVPVGKAYSGFTDEDLKWIDSFVRQHTTNRFGPVREVEKTLVFEVAFDSIHESNRHKSKLAMRFPRIARIRRDKPAAEADLVASLQAMIAS
jgi:DNA ligase-1